MIKLGRDATFKNKIASDFISGMSLFGNSRGITLQDMQTKAKPRQLQEERKRTL